MGRESRVGTYHPQPMGTPFGRGTAALSAVAASLAVAWLVPQLAIVVVWPLLLFVPGWALLALRPSRLDLPARLGLGVVLSVAVSTHLVYWLSHLNGGYARATIFLAAAILGLPAALAVSRGGFGRVPDLRASRGALAVSAAAGGLVAVVLGAGIWRVTPKGVTSGGSNWSDLGVHLSIAETVNSGANFPPEVPYFAGVPLVYHWFADFHAAILAEAAGIFSVPAMVLQSAVLSAALALLVHSFARAVVRGRHARRIATLAAVIAIFGGGLGYVRLIGDLAATGKGPLDLIAAGGYDNQWLTGWPYFRIPSVMGTGLLVHRATTAGLPILVGAVLVLLAGLPTARARAAGRRDRPLLIGLAGILGALLAPFHFFLFPAFLMVALLYVLVSGRLFDRDAPRNAALLLAPYVLAAPFVLAPLLNANASGALKQVSGWESAPMADGFWPVVFFYVTNLGVPFLLALGALFVRGLRAKAFLAAWALAMFVVPNVVQVSVIAFDMNKYFQAMWIAVAILAGWFIRRWPWPAAAVVLLLSVPSPLLVAGWTAFNREQVLDRNGVDAASWIADNTPERSVFATDGWLNSPTDPAGRLRLLTYTPYVANLGFDPDLRHRQVLEIYCSGDPLRAVALMRQLGATYLLDGTRPQPCDKPTDFAASTALEQVYANPGLRIWRLTAAAAGPGP